MSACDVPGSKTVLPVRTDCSTLTDPSRRSSITFSGTCTNGHGITSVPMASMPAASVVPAAASFSLRKSSASPGISGSRLNSESLTTSIGGW